MQYFLMHYATTRRLHFYVRGKLMFCLVKIYEFIIYIMMQIQVCLFSPQLSEKDLIFSVYQTNLLYFKLYVT